MATTLPLSATDETSAWLAGLPNVAGVRPLDRMPDAVRTPLRPAYRRQRPPDEVLPTAPRQEILSLVRESGVLRWRAGAVSTLGPMRRAGGRAALASGEVVKQYAFERLETSQVYSTLVGLDQTLTPDASYTGSVNNGLRRLQNGQLVPFADAKKAAKKKVLLIVHGTFSKTEALITNGLQKSTIGAKLLADAEKKYDLVLAFDHPTLSVSPMLNAFDLAALLRPAPASIDIVCHSRGGLVARWFCEAYADPSVKRRVVFVGAPLAGTSFAAAPRLKSAMDLLTNIADALRTAGDLFSANPLFLATNGLLRVASAVTGLAAKTPILDAAIALVPGLDAQSRVGNNQELLRLRANTGTGDFTAGQIRYFAVQSNFEPKDMGWNFLRLFSKPLQRLGDWGADVIFQGENDLIVDTGSMCEVADKCVVSVAHDFGTTDRVHHTNYFEQTETAEAIRKSFSIP
jgi:pimeloyl-ACP methyl ester carboxylesterase